MIPYLLLIGSKDLAAGRTVEAMVFSDVKKCAKSQGQLCALDVGNRKIRQRGDT
jgi:hypothetical protein